MFENEIVINEFQVGQLVRIAQDLNDETLFGRAPGHNHPAAWILGHLAITGELGQRILGGRVAHPSWLRTFGPGSSDDPSEVMAAELHVNLATLVEAIEAAYFGFRTLASGDLSGFDADAPHHNKNFSGSPIKTKGQLIALLLTNHFGFHVAQLSACRRSAGHPHLF